MHKLFHKIRKLRTNENILITIDILYNSKVSFMGIFLMAFMIGVSLKSSPVSFINMELSNYAFCGILSIIMADILCTHPIASWRTGMIFSIIRIVAVIIIDPEFVFFPLIIGFLGALESQLYWRPKTFLEVKEVSNSRRDRFSSLRQILVEITKIVMPIILGIVISDAGYRRAANIILAISVVQLLLSILFRPTNKIKIKTHSLKDALKYAVSHKNIRRVLWLQTLRGMVMTGCAYEIVTQLNIYSSNSSNVELGSYQSIASLVAIALLLLYCRFKTKASTKSEAIIVALLPAAVLLPVTAIIFPGNFIIAIVLFVYFRSVVQSLYSSTVFAVYHQDELKKSVHDDVYRIEIDILSELWLCVGRVISIIPLLLLVCLNRNDLILPLIAIQSRLIPLILIIIRKCETSQASSRR